MINDPKLARWATPTQQQYLEAVIEHGGYRPAAKALGVHPKSITKSLKSLARKAGLQGYAPNDGMTIAVPEGMGISRVSTLYKVDERGKTQSQQWVIAKRDEQVAVQQMKAVVEAMASEIVPSKPVLPPSLTDTALCNLYTVTDYHLGMAVSKADGGNAAWDLTIAEDTLVNIFENLIARSPAAQTGILNQLGDFLHFDGLEPVTPTSHHVLDAASRYDEMVTVVIRVLRRVISMLLTKHQVVHVILAEGNHDLSSSVWLRKLFAALYENEPRVTVDQSVLPYYAFQFGKCFLGFSHGHKRKKEGLPLLFAAMFREMFGATKAGWIHCGHEHHTDEKEYPGFKVIQHPTMAVPDCYAMRGGWMSEREASVITYHQAGFQVGRTTVTPEMLELQAA